MSHVLGISYYQDHVYEHKSIQNKYYEISNFLSIRRRSSGTQK